MNTADPAWMLGLVIIGFAFGIVVGIIISYLLLTQNKRAGQLQAQLDRARSEFDGYRDEVNRHFLTTSELFQDMSRQYKAVYDHLASGARHLCNEEIETPRLDLPELRVLERSKVADKAEPPAGEDEAEYTASVAPVADSEQVRQTA